LLFFVTISWQFLRPSPSRLHVASRSHPSYPGTSIQLRGRAASVMSDAAGMLAIAPICWHDMLGSEQCFSEDCTAGAEDTDRGHTDMFSSIFSSLLVARCLDTYLRFTKKESYRHIDCYSAIAIHILAHEQCISCIAIDSIALCQAYLCKSNAGYLV
jgi:hypothetical protein